MDVKVYDFGRNLKRQFCTEVSFADFLFERFTSILLVLGIAVQIEMIIFLILAIILFFGMFLYVFSLIYIYVVFFI